MRASIYRVRQRGIRLPRAVPPVTGDLRMDAETQGGGTMLVARLMGAGTTEALPTLFKAQVSKVTASGMVINGTEYLSRGQQKSRSHPVPQTWWVFIHTESGMYRYDGNDPLDYMADDAILNRSRAPPKP